jgi:hypothetical protein
MNCFGHLDCYKQNSCNMAAGWVNFVGFAIDIQFVGLYRDKDYDESSSHLNLVGFEIAVQFVGLYRDNENHRQECLCYYLCSRFV